MIKNFKFAHLLINSVAIIFISLTAAAICFAQSAEKHPSTTKSNVAEGDNDSCIRNYSALIASEPKNDGNYAERSRCYYLKAESLMKANEPTAASDAEITSALADAEKALAMNPKNTAALNIRGLVKAYRKDEQSAIADFTRMIEIDPKSQKAYFNRGVSKLQLRDFDGAIADFTKVIELNPQMSLAYSYRGSLYGRLGKREEAIKDYTRVVELDPTNQKAIDSIARLKGETNPNTNNAVTNATTAADNKRRTPTPEELKEQARNRSQKNREASAQAVQMAKKTGQMADELFNNQTNGSGKKDCVSGNCVNGFGKYVFPAGDIYEGNWVNGKREGQGIFTVKNGEIYTGQFANDKRNGKGKLVFPNGNVYEGNFVNGIYEGKGTYSNNKGDYYTGEWKDSKQNGYGKEYINATKIVREGKWQDGKFLGSASDSANNETPRTLNTEDEWQKICLPFVKKAEDAVKDKKDDEFVKKIYFDFSRTVSESGSSPKVRNLRRNLLKTIFQSGRPELMKFIREQLKKLDYDKDDERYITTISGIYV